MEGDFYGVRHGARSKAAVWNVSARSDGVSRSLQG